MDTALKIIWLPNSNINRIAWDACLDKFYPQQLYMRSWFLDTMVPNWQAMVECSHPDGPYHSIFVLPARKKWGIAYLYQPYLTAQLGYVGSDQSPENLQRFLDAIPATFKLWDFCANERNQFLPQKYPLTLRNNRLLELSAYGPNHQELYASNTKRNIKLAEKNQLQYKESEPNSWPPALDFYLQQSPFPPAAEDEKRLKKLLSICAEKSQLTISTISTLEGEWLAVVLWIWQSNRAYYLLPAISEAGKNQGASAALIDGFIKAHADQNILIDFEGSDIESVDRFYAGFGAINSPYPAVKRKRWKFL